VIASHKPPCQYLGTSSQHNNLPVKSMAYHCYMPSPNINCALCLQTKPLLDSHFIPAAIYKNLIDPTGPIKNMIATNLSVASEESKQIKQPLLCQQCEIRFQQGGESWVLGRRLMPNGTFVFRDLLQQANPVATKDGVSFFTLATVPTVDHEKLLYFAVSIYWRAAVSDWDTPLGHYSKLALDPVLIEQLRKYLLGTDLFPSSVVLTVVVSAATNPRDVTTLPQFVQEVTQYQQVDWIMPGIGFALLMGENVPAPMQQISLSRSPYAIAISPVLDDRIEAAGAKHAQQSVATEKLQKKLDQAQLSGIK
jgi:hypothetical protein